MTVAIAMIMIKQITGCNHSYGSRKGYGKDNNGVTVTVIIISFQLRKTRRIKTKTAGAAALGTVNTTELVNTRISLPVSQSNSKELKLNYCEYHHTKKRSTRKLPFVLKSARSTNLYEI